MTRPAINPGVIGARGVVVLALVTVVTAGAIGVACDTEAPTGTPKPNPSAATHAQTPASRHDEPVVTARAPRPDELMMAALLDGSIEAPPEGGSTYRVDAYVAALILERLRRDPAPFLPFKGDPGDTAKPSLGYHLGPVSADSLWSRLGLRSGDIIEAVNGVPAHGDGWTDQALKRADNRVTVSIFREDVSFVLSYRLMGGMVWQQRVKTVDSEAPEAPDDIATANADSAPEPGQTPSAAPPDPLQGDPSPSPNRGTSGGGKRPSAPPSTPSRGSPDAAVQCKSPSRCTLARSRFDSIMRSPAKLESQARIVPAIRNNVFSGYKLKSVRPGSDVAKLGFRSGDKITHINGRDLTNDLEAMQLYLGLSSARSFKVRYLRGGKALTKTVELR